VRGVSGHQNLSWQVDGTAALGTLIPISLWWVYFDFVSHHRPHANAATVSVWMYLHLPLTMGIATIGAAVLNMVEHSGEHLPTEVRWLLVSAVATTLIATTALLTTVQLSPERQWTRRMGGRVMLVSAVVIALLGFANLKTIPLQIILVLLMLAPVFSAFRVWVEMQGERAALAESDEP
jgi:low temperature requirement protein LtrA